VKSSKTKEEQQAEGGGNKVKGTYTNKKKMGKIKGG